MFGPAGESVPQARSGGYRGQPGGPAGGNGVLVSIQQLLMIVAAAVPADPGQHRRREQLHHRVPHPHRYDHKTVQHPTCSASADHADGLTWVE